MSENIE